MSSPLLLTGNTLGTVIADVIMEGLIMNLLSVGVPIALSIVAISVLLYGKGSGGIKRRHIVILTGILVVAIGIFLFSYFS